MTTFWIEANENGTPKKVPHDGKKNCEFINSGNAREFLQQLRTNHPETKFRMVTCKIQITVGSWSEKVKTQTKVLREENDQMNALAAQHANIISNITNFLNA